MQLVSKKKTASFSGCVSGVKQPELPWSKTRCRRKTKMFKLPFGDLCQAQYCSSLCIHNLRLGRASKSGVWRSHCRRQCRCSTCCCHRPHCGGRSAKHHRHTSKPSLRHRWSSGLDADKSSCFAGGREKEMTDIRNSDRCIWDDHKEVRKIWKRIRPFIPETWKGFRVQGLNERMRFLRYEPGQFFLPHCDGSYERENGERSYITFQAYLNDDFEGGATTFLRWHAPSVGHNPEDREYEAVPKTGSVLIFQHDMLHEGSVLKSGRKYAMRTDIMYAPPTRDDNDRDDDYANDLLCSLGKCWSV